MSYDTYQHKKRSSQNYAIKRKRPKISEKLEKNRLWWRDTSSGESIAGRRGATREYITDMEGEIISEGALHITHNHRYDLSIIFEPQAKNCFFLFCVVVLTKIPLEKFAYIFDNFIITHRETTNYPCGISHSMFRRVPVWLAVILKFSQEIQLLKMFYFMRSHW